MVKHLAASGVVLVFLAVPGIASAVGIRDVAWTQANFDLLHTFDKPAVEQFVNSVKTDGIPAKVGEFAWVDIQGNRRYELVTREDLSGRAYYDYLAIYWSNEAGKIRVDWIEGVDLPSLDRILKDVDGDGIDELIVPSALDEHDPRGNVEWPSRVWPKVYRLRDGRYVDASPEFGAYYDTEVLPALDREIAGARQSLAGGGTTQTQKARELTVLELKREKITRMLGRAVNH
jgi:hypothetical protein